jgi:hypothetical protein
MIEPALPAAFRDALAALCGGWRVRDGVVHGPRGITVHFAQRHESSSPGHVDVEFRMAGRRSAWPPFRRAAEASLWDCIAGLGETMEARARFAAHAWSQSTASACLELALSRQGRFADHLHGEDRGAFTGWHAIQSPILAYGKGKSPQTLQSWCEQNPLLPPIAQVLADRLPDRRAPYGLKILLGARDVADVRIDGEHDVAASAAVQGLPWPRLEQPAFARIYAVLLHREEATPGAGH